MQQVRKRQKPINNKNDNDQAKPKLKKITRHEDELQRHASYGVLGLLAILILFLIARGLAAWLNIINGNDNNGDIENQKYYF